MINASKLVQRAIDEDDFDALSEYLDGEDLGADIPPNVQDPSDMFRLLPSGPGEHAHTVTLDDEGNGVSSQDGTPLHRHTVVDYLAMDADGHTHDLDELADVPSSLNPDGLPMSDHALDADLELA